MIQTHAESHSQEKLYNIAYTLSIITIVYNIVEGLVATFFGLQDETLALFGFGVDSFIETLSGTGIAYMITRIRRNPGSKQDKFEIQALKVTGYSFYILAAGLTISAILMLVYGHKPETTLTGVIISTISLAVMGILIYYKTKVGKALHSQPILADANCTRACMYMSGILLLSSLLYELTGIGYIDIIGTAGIIYFSIVEGKECFEKAKGIHTCGCGDSCH